METQSAQIGSSTGEKWGLVAILEVTRIERFFPSLVGCVGRPKEDRAALARAFVAKAVFKYANHPSVNRAASVGYFTTPNSVAGNEDMTI